VSRAFSTAQRQYSSWDRARLSVVVPIGVIVAVAILCIIVAVLSSAQRADEISLESERQMFARAIRNHSARVLREVESIASSDDAVANLRQHYDPTWAQKRLGIWLDTYFDHDAVFLIDPFGDITYGHSRWRRPDDTWYALAKTDLLPVLRTLHNASSFSERHRNVRVENFMGRPAIIAAVVVGQGPVQATDQTGTAEGTPVVMSVRVIDQDVLSDIASHLRIKNLRRINDTQAPAGDFVFSLNDADGVTLAHFAWTPSQPGAEIVNNVLPFLATALAGFTLLGAFVLRYMRRTAAAIIAGETRLHHLAMHDPLSGLPNRTYFSERLEAIIADVKYGGPPAVLLYIDLDHFKEVNDTLGHHVGDELIRNVTLRLSNVLRGSDTHPNDLVARLGGDEFAVLAAIGSDPDTMTALANRILTALCAPYSISNQTIVIGASIGIAVIDNKNAVAADIMRYADMALYRAKNEGRNRACIYDAVMDADLSSRKLLEIDLREAIVNDRFRLLYQPQVNSSGETMVGVEALCRWTHPTRGPIPPSEFIAVAEHSGLIVDLGQWVLRRACLEAQAWPGLSLAVNVSPLQFRRADFVSVVERILVETDFDPKRLELELTESTLLGNFEAAESAMRRLKNLGVRLALDDFGTGYSSLQYLRKFPFDKLKIDRSFVDSIEKAPDAAAIVHAIVGVGRGLGMRVTAEGVETADQHLFLRAAGVHIMQGFRFGCAVTVDEISDRLARPAAYQIALSETALAS
jgi:diguanylate cyclase (GGDEF)-like protein